MNKKTRKMPGDHRRISPWGVKWPQKEGIVAIPLVMEQKRQ